ncbi:hypothetical protein M7I_5761 [Glarea lozoyensis 74030]|uniref:Uncharacterized protein n=1 Tax=Glarea lozoyensis (strain ATCC 74030 / MF5533) TaxID=1104152 RepID=H0ESN3_GLAL7|nr:hypothetical protein M7I_5761 [Glarea lozoyensis 74030]
MADDSYLDESRTASMGTQIDEVNNSHDGSQLYEVATTSSHNGNPPSVDNEGSEYHPHSESAVSEPDLDACHQGDGEETGEVDEADEAGGENLEVDPEEDTEKPKGKKKKTNVVVPRPPRTLKPQDPNDLICPGTITSVSDFEYKKWEAVMARKRAKFVPQFDLTTPEGQAAKAKYDELFRNRVAQIFRAVMDCDNEEIIDLPTKNAEGVSAIAKKIVNHVFDPEFVEERCARVVEAIVDYDNGIIGITEANRSLKIEKKLTFDERFELVKKALRKSKNTCKNVLKNNDYIYTSMQVKTAVALTKLAKGEVPEVLLPRVDEMKALDEMPKGPRSNAKDPNKPKRKYKKNPKKAATETTEVDDAAPSQPRQKRKYTKRTPATQPPAEADNAEENTEQTQKPAKRTRTKKNAEPKPVEEGGVSAVAGPSRQVSRTASAEGSSRQASSTSSGRPGPSMTSPHASSEFTFRSSSDETMAINARMNNTQHVTGPPPTQVVMPRVPMFGAPGSDIVLDVRHAVRTVPHSAPRHQSDGRMSFADDYSAGNQDSMFEFGDLEEPLFGDE